VNAVVPKELTDILTAVVILAVAATTPEVGRLWQAALARRTAQQGEPRGERQGAEGTA